jgi:SAM-dependent methyltransferase
MYGLSSQYVENGVQSRDKDDSVYWKSAKEIDTWQVPAYKVARTVIDEKTLSTVLEIGCGLGDKAVRYFRSDNLKYLGIDQRSAIDIAREINSSSNFDWQQFDLEQPVELLDICKKFKPEVVLMLDVIEHLENPLPLLTVLLEISTTINVPILISTPNRENLIGGNFFGPPVNPLHVREWTKAEFLELLKDIGFTVDKSWDLFPRTYKLTPKEAWITLNRFMKFRKFLDSRSNQLHLIRSDSQINHKNES